MKNDKAYDSDGEINEYEFTEESMTIHSTRGEETVAFIKYRYDELVKLKETDTYLLLFINDITFYPVDKRNLLPEEQETLRGYVQAGLKIRKQRINSKK